MFRFLVGEKNDFTRNIPRAIFSRRIFFQKSVRIADGDHFIKQSDIFIVMRIGNAMDIAAVTAGQMVKKMKKLSGCRFCLAGFSEQSRTLYIQPLSSPPQPRKPSGIPPFGEQKIFSDNFARPPRLARKTFAGLHSFGLQTPCITFSLSASERYLMSNTASENRAFRWCNSATARVMKSCGISKSLSSHKMNSHSANTRPYLRLALFQTNRAIQKDVFIDQFPRRFLGYRALRPFQPR